MSNRKSVVHLCPRTGYAVTPCCGKTPFELPRTDRMTNDADKATCKRKRVESAMKTGAELIAEERNRVINAEGFDADNDDQYECNELQCAAQSYIEAAKTAVIRDDAETYHKDPPPEWPFDMSFWKPSNCPIRNLVKAGQFIAAELDRLNRKESRHE